MKKFLLKVYCWYDYFCQHTLSHWDVFLAIGHTLISFFIIILLCVCFVLKPSRVVFYDLYLGKVLFIAYLLLVWIFPILTSIIMAIEIPYKKLIRTKDFRLMDNKIRNTWNKRRFLWLLIRLMTFLLPYLLFIVLTGLFELAVNV